MIALTELQAQLVLAGVVFVLTSVLGSTIAYFYERRRAKTDLRERQREAARTVYEELSRLMDKRLYRMRQFAWALDRAVADKQDVESKWSDYRGVLYEWNDSLNRNLALILRYFGPLASEEFECNVAEMFAGANDELREHHRQHSGEMVTSMPILTLQDVDRYLQEIDDHIYRLNQHMLTAIAKRDYEPYGANRPGCSDGPVGRRRDVLLHEFKNQQSLR